MQHSRCGLRHWPRQATTAGSCQPPPDKLQLLRQVSSQAGTPLPHSGCLQQSSHIHSPSASFLNVVKTNFTIFTRLCSRFSRESGVCKALILTASVRVALTVANTVVTLVSR